MTDQADYLSLDERTLLTQCQVDIYRASGPGGQHRNKVSSAVRMTHKPTGVTATAADSRSQHENRRRALARLRMNIACTIRRAPEIEDLTIPPHVAECIFAPTKPARAGVKRLQIGRKDQRFWPVAAFLLDLLDACGGKLGKAAGLMNITTSNLATILKSDRHLLAAAQKIRKSNSLKPLA